MLLHLLLVAIFLYIRLAKNITKTCLNAAILCFAVSFLPTNNHSLIVACIVFAFLYIYDRSDRVCVEFVPIVIIQQLFVSVDIVYIVALIVLCPLFIFSYFPDVPLTFQQRTKLLDIHT